MMKKKTDTKNDKLFVTNVVSLHKTLKHQEEVDIISLVREKLLYMILVDGIDEAVKQCNSIINEVTEGLPVKGNVHYSFVRTEDEMNIEFVRHAHGGGNNQSVRDTGGVVIATLVIVKIKGELSPIHGFTWYHPEEFDPFAHLD